MPILGNQIIDTFVVRDITLAPIAGETFSAISVWVNGVTSTVVATIVESPISGGFYTLSFTPSSTGEWFVKFEGSPSGSFEAMYEVESAAASAVVDYNSIWTNSGTSVINNVWSQALTAYPVSGTFGGAVGELFKITRGKWQMLAPNTLKFFDEDGTTVIRQFNLFDLSGAASLTAVVRRDPI